VRAPRPLAHVLVSLLVAVALAGCGDDANGRMPGDDPAPTETLPSDVMPTPPQATPTPDTMASSPSPAPAGASLLRPEWHRGMTLAGWRAGEYRDPAADQILRRLAEDGTTHLAVVVTGYQETADTTWIDRSTSRTPTDDDLRHVVALAHELGMEVMLKPHVDLLDDPGRWRGDIGRSFEDQDTWYAWFDSYRRFIEHYATLAESMGVARFAVGTELSGASHRDGDWREVVRAVRDRYSGELTYAANPGEERRITWWDHPDLAYIGVDAYYRLANDGTPSVEALATAWADRGHLQTMEDLAATYGKPVLLTEVGYPSVPTAASRPPDEGVDPDAQARLYEAAFLALADQPWLAGAYWWAAYTVPGRSGPEDRSHNPLGKPAEEVLRRWHTGS
jgi:hypothetical protein